MHKILGNDMAFAVCPRLLSLDWISISIIRFSQLQKNSAWFLLYDL